MGRRKIEIKAIKDDRNRSVTFLKRKGGLFKKAHELSVLCSVDVAVFIFGNNKKLYEYSSSDMRDLIHRYQLHGTANEHKGPADFNGGNDDDDDDDADGSPPRAPAGVEPQMMPPQFHGQQPPFSQILRHHTPSASPPITHGVPFQGHHPGHHNPRGATPQPTAIDPRPSSRNDARRIGPNMAAAQPVGGPHASHPVGGPHASHPGITYMPTPPIYNPAAGQPGILPQHAGQYSYPHPHQQQPHPHQQQQHPHQQHPHPHPHPPYVEDRRPSAPPGYPAQHPPPRPPPPSQTAPAAVARPEPSPPQPGAHHLPPHPVPQVSPPTPQPAPERRPQEPHPPPPPVEPKTEPSDRPQPPLLNTDMAIKKMPQRKSHSIFTPIEENRSILSRHLASFAADTPPVKSESGAAGVAGAGGVAPPSHRSQSLDASASRDGVPTSPQLKRSSTQSSLDKTRNASVSSGPDSTFTPPSRANSLKAVAGARPRGPRLTVQIPDGASEPGSATGESNSPHNPAVTPTHTPQRHNSHSSVVLPPPSPSASALLSAGASGPPNPFARPPPQQNVNGETPVSALPSRFLNHELLHSPSSFYQDWSFRGSDNNAMPSPLNFATPVVGSGPSFLREDHHAGSSGNVAHGSAAVSNGGGGGGGQNILSGPAKRKSPDFGSSGHGEAHAAPNEPKRVKVEYA
ncbi:hypothetical protein CDD83_1501 [Cordyceps sp. RAO-2017]|nr:hypothetical protein CDD83_1501 [Cordyceps sp. RAO-2017]